MLTLGNFCLQSISSAIESSTSSENRCGSYLTFEYTFDKSKSLQTILMLRGSSGPMRSTLEIVSMIFFSESMLVDYVYMLQITHEQVMIRGTGHY